jgi:hypothetical protein
MKTVKWRVLATLALGGILICGNALSAAERSPAGRKRGGAGGGADVAQRQMDHMAQRLGLSEEQKSNLGELLRKSREELEQKVKDSKILTDEQFAKWKELQGERFSGAPGAAGWAGRQNPLTETAEQLGLSEEQKTKLLALMRDQFRDLGGLRRQGDQAPAQRLEQFKKSREELEQKVKDSGILTDEQFAKWKELQGQRFPGAGRRGKQ